MKQPLTIDEVLALQYFGMENSEILKMHLNTFEKLLNENPILDEYLSQFDILKFAGLPKFDLYTHKYMAGKRKKSGQGRSFYGRLNSIATSDKIFSNIEIFVEILSGFEERIDVRAQECAVEVIDWLKR